MVTPGTPSKVLVIGLDGIPFALLDVLYAKGLMSSLQGLQETGYQAPLRSTIPPMSPTAWTSLATGMNPGQHGVLHFVSVRPGEAREASSAQWIFPDYASLLNSERIKGVTLWQYLTKAEKRQVVVNVPLTYPPHPVNGIMVTGMLTPPHAPVFTYPPELSPQLREVGYEVDLDVEEKDFDQDHGYLLTRTRQVLRKRSVACLDLMAQARWDFFMVVFTTTDRIQHHCWKTLMPGHAEYDSPEAATLWPQMEAYFGELDRAIADLVREAGPETTTILLSDHGMGPIHNREVLTLSLMERLGIGSQVNRSGIGRLRWLLEGKLGLTPGQLRKWTKRVLPEDWTAKLDARVRDAQLTAGAEGPAYVTALHANVGGIYINRDDYPDVQSLRDFREALVAKLQALVDPENGAPLVKTIHRREELYHGDAVDECPDVIFTLHESYGFADGLGTGGRLVQPRRRRLGQQGIHRPEGILIINGPGVRQASDSPQQLLDVTATLLYLLDIPIPEKMDSRPILAPFPDLAHTRPPVYEEKYVPQQATSGTSQPASAADQEAILARLRGLGYIE